MDSEVLEELRIANLLKVLELTPIDCESDMINDRKKILDYILTREMSSLKLDVVLFPKKKDKKVKNVFALPSSKYEKEG